MRIKICGLTRLQDVQLAAECGAFALGFVFYPLSPRAISALSVKEISCDVSADIWKVGVFVNQSTDEILTIAQQAGLTHVQLHGDESPEQMNQIRNSGLEVIKALRITSESDLQKAAAYDCLLLLDAAVPGVWGGSGHQANWELAAELASQRQLILAGGLNATNLEAAAQVVKPWAFDLSSGVESAPGIKNHHDIQTLFAKARTIYDTSEFN